MDAPTDVPSLWQCKAIAQAGETVTAFYEGESYREERCGVAIVYVQNKDGKPLMPTTRCGHVRLLLKQKKAKVVETRPFTIRLCYTTPDVTQPLYLGIDPGRTNIGLCVVEENGEAVLAVQVITRNKEIPKLMTARKTHRTKHRQYGRRAKKRRRARKAGTVKAETFERKLPGCEKPIVLHDIRNKESRFSNRTRPSGWLTPTANHLLQTHINAVKKLAKYVPITDVTLELNSFAFMVLDNPDIKPWEYQRGQLFGYKGSVNNAVAATQNNHCIFCKSAITRYHHIVPRHKGGSDTLPNIAGLCEKHHALVHTKDDWAEKLSAVKSGLNKKYGALSVLNQIIPRLNKELAAMYPEHAYCIRGKDTKAYRDANGISKDHWLDAYCIAAVVLGTDAITPEIKPLTMLQFRRHDRQACNQEMLNRKYMLDGKVVATNRHKAFEQENISLDEYRDVLTQRIGDKGATAIISQLKVKEHPPRMKNMHRSLPGSIFVDIQDGGTYVMQGSKGFHNGKPDYFVDVAGKKHLASKCKFIQNNTGLRLIG